MNKFVLAVVSIIVVMAKSAMAYSSETVGGYSWCYDINGNTATIRGNSPWNRYPGVTPQPTGAMTIPSTLGGKPVVQIGYDAFYNCNKMTHVAIPSTVTSIGKTAFYGCSGLTSVAIPNTVTSIEESAFFGCSGLTNISMSSVTYIGYMAFEGCSGLTSVTIPNSVTSICSSAFSGCSGLTSVRIPDSVPWIGSQAFNGCGGLKSIEIGKNVTGIYWGAFSGCGKLTRITIPSSVTNIDSFAFYNCVELARIDFDGKPPKVYTSTFNNVKDSAIGTYTVTHAAEWKVKIDSNGYWYGLKMQMQEPPPLTLTAESADWSSGSITLRCEDSDTSGSEHKYTLEYKNASGAWEEVDGAKNKVATKGQDANGQEVLIAKLTDEAFWSRLGGLPPVEYRVKDENGRVSKGCVTRNRHGLYVGVGEYEDGEKRGLPSLPFAPSDASKFKGIAEKHAKFSGRPVYANHDATIEAVDAALGDLVDCSQSGDICLFYITTHGGYDGKDGLICLYDGDYTHSALTEKVSRMTDKGIAFIAVVGTCHAEAMLQMDFPNAAVVAAATMETLSTATFDEIFMYDGWEDCCAAPGPTMTFENLADYAIEKYNSLFGGIDFLDEDAEECYPYRMSATKNDVGGLLGKIVARTDCTSDFDIATKPSVVSGFSATTNDSEKISVLWNAVQGAERYYLFYGRLGNPQFLGYKVIEIDDGTSCAFGIDKDWVKESSKTAPARFMVKAYNVAGVSPAAVATGWRYRTFSIIFYTIDHERVDWDEPSFNRYKDDEVVKCVEYGDEYILKCLPKAKKPGYYLKGWYDLNDNEAVAGLTLNSDAMYHAEWREIAMPQIWLDEHVDIVEHSGGDLATAAAMTAANGTRTVDECYRLGIDPEDPNDDLKIAGFKMKDGKPEITLNHTKDGSGNSFEDRVKILGKAELSDAEWQEVPPEGNPAHRFFTVDVEMPQASGVLEQ